MDNSTTLVPDAANFVTSNPGLVAAFTAPAIVAVAPVAAAGAVLTPLSFGYGGVVAGLCALY